MAASAWTVFDVAKHRIGDGGIDLSGGTFRMSLHRSSASTNLTAAITAWSSIGDECSGGGYSAIQLSGTTWTAGASAGQQAWDHTDPVFTASSSVLSAVRQWRPSQVIEIVNLVNSGEASNDEVILSEAA
jgi:hypothetical protein